MSSLIAIAIHSTEKNFRFKYTKETLTSIVKTVDFNKHRLCLIDDDSSKETKVFLKNFQKIFGAMFPVEHLTVLTNSTNIGTANSLNRAIKLRRENEFVIKQDDDTVIDCNDWVEQMEECFKRQPLLGILGLKRRDLDECPSNPNEQYRSKLTMLKRDKGQSWLIIEQVQGVMGTCTMFNPKLLDKIGYMQQIGLYGFDDSVISLKSTLAGFGNAFLPHIYINHIDSGRDDKGELTDYIKWKQKVFERVGSDVQKLTQGLNNGSVPLYFEPKWDEIEPTKVVAKKVIKKKK